MHPSSIAIISCLVLLGTVNLSLQQYPLNNNAQEQNAHRTNSAREQQWIEATSGKIQQIRALAMAAEKARILAANLTQLLASLQYYGILAQAEGTNLYPADATNPALAHLAVAAQELYNDLLMELANTQQYPIYKANNQQRKHNMSPSAPNEVEENRYYYQPYEDVAENQELESPAEASRQQWPMDYSHNFMMTENQEVRDWAG